MSTTKAEHTAEPWIIGTSEDADAIHCIDAETEAGIMEVAKVWGTYKKDQESTESQANALRIVSCVNGCTGIANPSAVKDVVEALRRILRAVELCDWSHERAQSPDTQYELSAAEDIARAALAKLDQP